MILITLLLINYFLIVLFLKSYYLIYFVTLGLVALWVYFIKKRVSKYFTFLTVLVLNISTFLFEYFDDDIYDIYLFFNLNEIYTFVGGETIYILALLHSLILFGL